MISLWWEPYLVHSSLHQHSLDLRLVICLLVWFCLDNPILNMLHAHLVSCDKKRRTPTVKQPGNRFSRLIYDRGCENHGCGTTRHLHMYYRNRAPQVRVDNQYFFWINIVRAGTTLGNIERAGARMWNALWGKIEEGAQTDEYGCIFLRSRYAIDRGWGRTY